MSEITLICVTEPVSLVCASSGVQGPQGIQGEPCSDTSTWVADETELLAVIDGITDGCAQITIAQEIPIIADLTIPESVNLKFLRCGMLSPESGVTLTVNSTIDAGLWRIFGGDGEVAVLSKVEAVYPEWFGAVGDGVVDDSGAIQRAVDVGKSIRFSCRTYLIGSTINLYAHQDITGSGHDSLFLAGHTGVLFTVNSTVKTMSGAFNAAGSFGRVRIKRASDDIYCGGIFTIRTQNYRIYDLRAEGVRSTGPLIDNVAAYGTSLEHCVFRYCTAPSAIHLRQQTDESEFSYNIKIDKCDITGLYNGAETAIGIEQKGGQLAVTDTVIEDTTIGVLVGSTTGFTPIITLKHVYMEANSQAHIKAIGTGDYAATIKADMSFLNNGPTAPSEGSVALASGNTLIVDMVRTGGIGSGLGNIVGTGRVIHRTGMPNNLNIDVYNNKPGLFALQDTPSRVITEHNNTPKLVPGVSLYLPHIYNSAYTSLLLITRMNSYGVYASFLYAITTTNTTRGYTATLISSDSAGGLSAAPIFSINEEDATDYNLYYKFQNGYAAVTCIVPSLR